METALTPRTSTAAGYAQLVLDRLTRLACRTVGADHACILVCDRADPRAAVAVTAQGLDEDLIGRRFARDEGVVGKVMHSLSATSFADPRDLPFPLDALSDERLASGACAPIEWDDLVQGALVVVSRRLGRRRFARGELAVLGAVAGMAGAALGHAEHREHIEETLRARVDALALALELRDEVTGRHVREVVRLALEVGERLGLDPAAMVELEFAARLHDVGKLAVPDAILGKPGPLIGEEWEPIRRHPEWGSGMLARIPGLEAVAVLVRFHHERYDGDGYPDGLGGERIPLASRIIAVCDAYHAIVADRPYRRGRSRAVALDELRAHAGTQFDPDVVAAFLERGRKGPPDVARATASQTVRPSPRRTTPSAVDPRAWPASPPRGPSAREESLSMRTYTTREAAELTGSTVRALRKRIERGQLRAVQHGRFWRIPHSELERLGLLGPFEDRAPSEGTEGADGGEAFVLAALEQLRAENRRLTEEIDRLRASVPPAEPSSSGDLERERAERQAAEARAEAEAAAVAELRERERYLAQSGFLAQWRLLREWRREARAAAGRGYEIPEDLRRRLETLPWWSSEGTEEGRELASARPAEVPAGEVHEHCGRGREGATEPEPCESVSGGTSSND